MAPFNMFGGAPPYFDFSQYGQQPAADLGGLTLEDLYVPRSRPVAPPAPPLPNAFGELGDEAKKELRREAILRAAMALGGPSGQIGQNLLGAAASLSGFKRERVEEARQRAKEEYNVKVKQAELDASREELDREDEMSRRKAEGRLAAVRAITEKDPDMGSRAEAAALRGDDGELREIFKDFQRRQAMKARGEDPDDPFADERAKAKIQTDETLRLDEERKKRGYSIYFDDDPSLSEIEARAAASARGQRSVWGDRGGSADRGLDAEIRTINGKVYEVFRDEQGAIRTRPLPGQPESEGEWSLIRGDKTLGEPDYYVNPSGQSRPVPPPPPPVGQVLRNIESTLGRKLTVKERSEAQEKYTKGTKPRDIVAGLRAPQKITNPASAPSQGPLPQKAPPKGGPPKQAVPPGVKPKVTERDKSELRSSIDKRFAALTPAEREQKYQRALRHLLAGS